MSGLDVPSAVAGSGQAIYVTGTTCDGPSSSTTMQTVAYNGTTGALLWVDVYRGYGTSRASDIAVSPDGTRVYVTGYQNWHGVCLETGCDPPIQVRDAVTIAYDAATGARIWTSVVPPRAAAPDATPLGLSWNRQIQVSADGVRLYISGTSPRPGTYETQPPQDVTVASYVAATGEQDWEARRQAPPGYDAAGSLEPMAMAVLGRRIFATGDFAPDWFSDPEGALTVVYDDLRGTHEGREVWVASEDRVGPRDIDVTGTSVYVAAAGASGEQTAITIAYDAATGARRWTQIYRPEQGSPAPYAVAVSTKLGLIYMAGWTAGPGTSGTGNSGWVIAYDSVTGTRRWFSAPSVPGTTYQALAISSDDSALFAVGGVLGGEGSAAGFLTVAYDPRTGSQRWLARYSFHPTDADVAQHVYVSSDSSRVFAVGPNLHYYDPTTSDLTDYGTVAYDTGLGPTAVSVLAFDASLRGRQPELRWRTALEAQVLGYNVFRDGPGGTLKVNKRLIAARGSGRGERTTYTLLDYRARRGVTYGYRLQIVKLDGTRAWVASTRLTAR
ncbi:MAG: PQQ-binding-like beta-propeller repeat protein [Gaiellaceae bacterium]